RTLPHLPYTTLLPIYGRAVTLTPHWEARHAEATTTWAVPGARSRRIRIIRGSEGVDGESIFDRPSLLIPLSPQNPDTTCSPWIRDRGGRGRRASGHGRNRRQRRGGEPDPGRAPPAHGH